MLRTRIAGTGRATPDKVLTNDDLSKMVATSDAWIRERTGIRERHIAGPDECSSDLAVAAAQTQLPAVSLSAAAGGSSASGCGSTARRAC